MKIHELNCGTLCPFSQRLTNGQGSWFRSGQLICRCLLIETGSGLVLVDSGIGLRDMENPLKRLGREGLIALRPRLDRTETAWEQIKQLGFRPEDVRDIIVTHLDFDHAGGLADFPWARVHIYEEEFQAAVQGQARDKNRYRPIQWAHHPHWERYKTQGETWQGWNTVRELPGLPPEILLVPLIGHSQGHTGVAIQQNDQWLFHAGDAIFDQRELDEPSGCPLGLRVFLNAFANDKTLRAFNTQRLRDLKKNSGGNIQIVCSHDPQSSLVTA